MKILKSACRRFLALSLVALSSAAFCAVAQTVNLPKVDILGTEYYSYEVKKGDSPYGVAKRYGWDYNRLSELNPEVCRDMKKGSRLYYPVGSAPRAAEAVPQFQSQRASEIEHLVKRGETVYSIARQYGVPVETIYASCPSAKTGIKAGETIRINVQAEPVTDIIYYTIRRGDTLYAVANQYDTTVEKILSLNPGVSEQNFQAGATIRIAQGSKGKDRRVETVTEEQVAGFDSYTVGKGDTWESVASQTGTDVERLREANGGRTELKKNDIIAVPQVETVEVQREVPFVDDREQTASGRMEMYDSIHGIDRTEAALAAIAIVTDKPSQTRNIEFLRGFLLNLDRIKKSGKKVNLTVIDATNSADSVTAKLREADPKAILSTFDKDAPQFIIDFASQNAIELINVFDVRSEEFLDNPWVMQLMPPSGYFNEAVVAYLTDHFADYTLLTVGQDATDEIGKTFTTRRGHHINIPLEDLDQYPLLDDKKYIIYAYPTKKEDVTRMLDAVEKIKEEAPFAEVVIIGRPAWVTLTQTLKDKFDMQDVYIPSRFYFDPESSDGKRFVNDYTALYGHGPLRSFPVYAVSGYDMASWIVPTLLENGGDFNRGAANVDLLQNNINFRRVSNWGGFLNTDAYIVRFNPYGLVEKIVIQ